jgi:hypothetical protein
MKQQRFYKITSTCKSDMKIMLWNRIEEINKLTSNEMEYIAGKLADDYCNQLYWSSLENIVEDVLDEKKDEREREEAVPKKWVKMLKKEGLAEEGKVYEVIQENSGALIRLRISPTDTWAVYKKDTVEVIK